MEEEAITDPLVLPVLLHLPHLLLSNSKRRPAEALEAAKMTPTGALQQRGGRLPAPGWLESRKSDVTRRATMDAKPAMRVEHRVEPVAVAVREEETHRLRTVTIILEKQAAVPTIPLGSLPPRRDPRRVLGWPVILVSDVRRRVIMAKRLQKPVQMPVEHLAPDLGEEEEERLPTLLHHHNVETTPTGRY